MQLQWLKHFKTDLTSFGMLRDFFCKCFYSTIFIFIILTLQIKIWTQNIISLWYIFKMYLNKEVKISCTLTDNIKTLFKKGCISNINPLTTFV